jgi:hypothetical protein
MDFNRKLASAVGAVVLLASGAANAALQNGFSDASYNTSVFISVVERNSSNQAVRSLMIDTGTRTLDSFAGTPWSTTAAQEAEILGFLAAKGANSTVLFNIGGALNDQSFSTDLYGFLTTGNAAGPSISDFSALGNAVTNIDTIIGDTAGGTFNVNGILAVNSASDPGWHEDAWGNSVGGAILPSNEVLFGQASQLVGWDMNPDFEIIRSILGPVSSDLATGDISFGVQAAVPVPASVWLFGSALGLLGALRRRMAA